MKKTIMLIAVLFLTTLFSGCAEPEKVYIKPKLPHLKECKVKRIKVKAFGGDRRVCYELNEYKKLKDTNRRLRICNELLNRQITDFNKKFVEEK